MNRSGAPVNCWLFCLIYVCCLLNHLACTTLDGKIPLLSFTGITPDISIIILFTFYQPVFYATYDQHFPSESEDRAGYWVVPNVFIRSRQGDDGRSIIKPMPESDPDNLIGGTFLLPPQENGERLRPKVTKKVVEEIEAADGNRIPNINFIIDIGEGKVEELITYNQLLDHLEQADEQDNSMDQELYRFRAIIGHEGPLKATDPNWKGSKWNVLIEWETGEITFEPLSAIAADDPITCAAYAKEKNLYNLDGWKRFRHLIKKEKQLSRAIKQSKIRQVRHAKKYMFGFLIPRNYIEALEFDKANNNSKV